MLNIQEWEMESGGWFANVLNHWNILVMEAFSAFVWKNVFARFGYTMLKIRMSTSAWHFCSLIARTPGVTHILQILLLHLRFLWENEHKTYNNWRTNTSYRNVMKYDDNWELKIGSLENFDRIHHHCTSVNEVLWSTVFGSIFVLCNPLEKQTPSHKVAMMLIVTGSFCNESFQKTSMSSFFNGIGECVPPKCILWHGLPRISILLWCRMQMQDVKAVKWHPQQDVLFSCSYDDTIKARANMSLWKLEIGMCLTWVEKCGLMAPKITKAINL